MKKEKETIWIWISNNLTKIFWLRIYINKTLRIECKMNISITWTKDSSCAIANTVLSYITQSWYNKIRNLHSISKNTRNIVYFLINSNKKQVKINNNLFITISMSFKKLKIIAMIILIYIILLTNKITNQILLMYKLIGMNI